ncbi:hypothetical protein [Halomonas denitrificans]|nr:hypothetical protein [Halomonas denitrificans]
MVRRSLATLLLVGLALPMSGLGQPAPDDPGRDDRFDPAVVSLDGRWQTYYEDRNLGRVPGVVEVDEVAETVRAIYRHPVDDREYTLVSTRYVRSGATLRVDMEGESPVLWLNDGHGYPQHHLIVPESARELEARSGGNTLRIAIAERKPSDRHRLSLDMELVAADTLLGAWSYVADPFTGRARDGGGRVGDFSIADDGTGLQQGTEAWSRPEPIIDLAFVLPDQLSYAGGFSDLPNYPHRFQDNGHRRDNDYRTLVVVGRNLPQGPRHAARFVSESEGVSYSFVRYGRRMARDAHGNDELSRAEEKLLALLPEGTSREALTDLDFVVVRADLVPGVKPGIQSFTMNGLAGSWMLEFGDNRATVRFVRAVRPTSAGMEGRAFEATRDAFIPEALQIEIVTALDLDEETLWVMPGRNGAPMRLGPDGARVPAHRTDRPRTYRTDPLHLVDIGSEAAASVGQAPAIALPPAPTSAAYHVVPVAPGDLLTAALADETGLVSIGPAVARLQMHRSPADPGVETQWKAYLSEAARCSGIELEDFAAANHRDVHRFNERRLFFWDTLSTTVQLGDYAALILLRKSFLDLMQDRYDQYAQERSDEEIVAFRRGIEPEVLAHAHALGDVQVTGEGGEQMPFSETYETDNAGNRYRHGRLDVPPWVIAATREALSTYAERIESARDVAVDIDPCDTDDIDELLELTGTGFDAIRLQLFPRLVLLGDSSLPGERNPTWEPDYDARFRVWRIAQLAQQVSTYEALSEEDTDLILMAVDIALVPVAVWGGFAGMVASLVIEAAQIGSEAYDIGSAYASSERELAFALGAVEVLGHGRLRRAEAEAVTLFQTVTAFGFMVSAELVMEFVPRGVGEIFSDIRSVHRRASWLRGRSLLQRYEFDPGRIPTGLNRRDYTDMLRFMGERRGLRNAAAALDDDSRRLLDNLRNLETSAPVPAWTRGMSVLFDAAQRPIYFRRDLRSMTDEGREVIRAALDSGGRRASEAREMLLYTPWNGAADFRRRLELRMSRRREPLGEEAYTQASMENPQSRRALSRKGWFINFKRMETGADMITIRAPNGTQDELIRRYDPSTGTLSLQKAYREHIPANIDAELPVRLSERGFPAFLFAQLRYLNRVGVGYGGAGRNPLREVHMSFVMNSRTNVQITWFKQTHYPELSWDEFIEQAGVSEFLMNTRSLDYARSLIDLAGYRIRNARLDLTGTGYALGGFRESHIPGPAEESFDDYLRRHGLRETDEGPPPFDIVLEVEPHPAARRAATSRSDGDSPTDPSARDIRRDEGAGALSGGHEGTGTRRTGNDAIDPSDAGTERMSDDASARSRTERMDGGGDGGDPPDDAARSGGDFNGPDDLAEYLERLRETVEEQAELAEELYRRRSRDDFRLTDSERADLRRRVEDDPANAGRSAPEVEALVERAERSARERTRERIGGAIARRDRIVPGLIDAVEESLDAGVPFEQIAAGVRRFRRAGSEGDMIDSIRGLERLHLEARGLHVLSPENPDVVDLEILLANALTEDLGARDLRLLDDFVEGSSRQGRDFFDDLESTGTMTREEPFERLASPDEIDRLRRIHARHREAGGAGAADAAGDAGVAAHGRDRDLLEGPGPNAGGPTGTERMNRPLERTERLDLVLPASAGRELDELISRYNRNAGSGRRIGTAEQLFLHDLVAKQVALGVPREVAYELARRDFLRLSGAGGSPDLRVRAEMLARSVISDGSRQMSLDEFVRISGLPRDEAERALGNVLADAGLAPLPDHVSPARFYPDVGLQ